jgi:hypothetical protein
MHETVWSSPTGRLYNGQVVEENVMVRSIEGVYRDGKVELLEPAPVGAEGRVIVTLVR